MLWVRMSVSMMKAHFWISRLDRRAAELLATARHRHKVWNTVFRLLARFGPLLFFTEMAGLLAWTLVSVQGAFGAACFAVSTAVASALCTKIIVDLLADHLKRTRPFVSLGYEPLIDKNPQDPSFPSNHAGGAFALGTSLALSFPHSAPLTLTLALLIAFARLYAGLHYLTDVAVGAAMGSLVAAFLWLLLNRVV